METTDKRDIGEYIMSYLKKIIGKDMEAQVYRLECGHTRKMSYYHRNKDYLRCDECIRENTKRSKK